MPTESIIHKNPKPLGGRAYGSIPHLPHSRMGLGDHHITHGQARICTKEARDRHDVVIVQEKLDGSCVSVARIESEFDGPAITSLTRAGYCAITSPFEQHHLFADWVTANAGRFHALLGVGERVVGEWLAQAHGTRYNLTHDPFVAFDIMRGDKRLPFKVAYSRLEAAGLVTPYTISVGSPMSVVAAMNALGQFGKHGATEPVEGVVYRVERKGEVDFLAKFVRPEKTDGKYLPELTGHDPVWNWRP